MSAPTKRRTPEGSAREPGPNVLGVIAPRVQELARSETELLRDVTARELLRGSAENDDVTLAWELARLVPHAQRGHAFALAVRVLQAAEGGSTRVELRGTRPSIAHATGDASTLDSQLSLPFEGSRAEAEPELTPLVGSHASDAPLVRSGAHVALRRWAATERTIARDLAARAAADHGDIESARARARELVETLREVPLPGPRGPMLLTDEQEAAVASMMVDRTVVLTGGPGTGKTSVVVSVLRALARRAHAEGGEAAAIDTIRHVALAAPTGKAADRLGEAVRTSLARSSEPLDALVARHLESPTTIHRLLGYRHRLGRSGEGSFRAHRHNQLAQRLVLVDEVSMIDTVLFERLLAAVAPTSSLVLLGDPDQLPSVDPGAVLRDLLRSAPPGLAVRRLTRSHRMDPSDPDGAHVLSVARACLAIERDADAERPSFHRLRPGEPSTPIGLGGAWHLEASSLARSLDAWIARHLHVPALAMLDGVAVAATGETPSPVIDALTQLSRARILTVTRRAAEDLDAYVSASFARWRGEPVRARRVLPGEPVMVVHNDYDEDLWNGDSGVVWRDASGELLASFRRGVGVRTRPLAAIAHLVERSHAVTVHKAQGSEHDEIFFVLPSVDTALSTREIVYTAITRARRSAIVVGRADLLDDALARASARETGLVDALRDAFGEEAGTPASMGVTPRQEGGS